MFFDQTPALCDTARAGSCSVIVVARQQLVPMLRRQRLLADRTDRGLDVLQLVDLLRQHLGPALEILTISARRASTTFWLWVISCSTVACVRLDARRLLRLRLHVRPGSWSAAARTSCCWLWVRRAVSNCACCTFAAANACSVSSCSGPGRTQALDGLPRPRQWRSVPVPDGGCRPRYRPGPFAARCVAPPAFAGSRTCVSSSACVACASS